MQQKTLLNLGASFPIPKPQWAELVEIIEAKLAGNEFLFELAPKLAAAAERIVERLRSRELEKPTDESLDGDLAHIRLDSVEMDNAHSMGSERLALASLEALGVNRHSTVTHYQRPNMTHPQEGGTGGEVSEILFFSAKSKRRPSLIYSMQIIPVCLSIVARRKGVSATRRGGLNWTPISLLVGHPCKLFHTLALSLKTANVHYQQSWPKQELKQIGSMSWT